MPGHLGPAADHLRPILTNNSHVGIYEYAVVPYPANTGHCPCVGSMLAHRLRRWPNIEPTHGQCPVFAGYILIMITNYNN